jgi:hypothetical protein
MSIKQRLQTLVLTLSVATNLPPGQHQSHLDSFFDSVKKMQLDQHSEIIFYLEEKMTNDFRSKKLACISIVDGFEIVIEARIGQRSQNFLQIFSDFGEGQNFKTSDRFDG